MSTTCIRRMFMAGALLSQSSLLPGEAAAGKFLAEGRASTVPGAHARETHRAATSAER